MKTKVKLPLLDRIMYRIGWQRIPKGNGVYVKPFYRKPARKIIPLNSGEEGVSEASADMPSKPLPGQIPLIDEDGFDTGLVVSGERKL